MALGSLGGLFSSGQVICQCQCHSQSQQQLVALPQQTLLQAFHNLARAPMGWAYEYNPNVLLLDGFPAIHRRTCYAVEYKP
jgi:hypothetical protein